MHFENCFDFQNESAHKSFKITLWFVEKYFWKMRKKLRIFGPINLLPMPSKNADSCRLLGLYIHKRKKTLSKELSNNCKTFSAKFIGNLPMTTENRHFWSYWWLGSSPESWRRVVLAKARARIWARARIHCWARRGKNSMSQLVTIKGAHPSIHEF